MLHSSEELSEMLGDTSLQSSLKSKVMNVWLLTPLLHSWLAIIHDAERSVCVFIAYYTFVKAWTWKSMLWLSPRLLLSLCVMTDSVYKCLQTSEILRPRKCLKWAPMWGGISTFHCWQPKRRQRLISSTDEWGSVCVGTMLKQIGAYDYFFTGDWRITVSFWHSLATGIFLTEA